MKSLYIKPESRIIIIDTDEMMQLAPASNSDLPQMTDPDALLLPVTTDDEKDNLDLCSKRFSAWDTWEDDTWEE